MSEMRPVVAVLGGSGALGGGIAFRLARAGYRVVIGSREAGKAAAAAEEIAAELGEGAELTGLDNAAAAAAGEIVVIAVPYASHAAILETMRPHVAGKVVVDTTVPLVPPKVATARMPAGGCAALETAQALGEGVRVVSGFHNVAAAKLRRGGEVGCDVLIFGDEVAARDSVVELAGAMGLRGVHGGPLANSVAAEAMTSVLIGINRRYKVDGAGIRITGDLAGLEQV